jgi:hypothetical protein
MNLLNPLNPITKKVFELTGVLCASAGDKYLI